MLIDNVTEVCRRLAGKGWAKLLDKHDLDIRARDLEAELARELPHIDRTVPGFEDFAFEGRRGIEPGHPARSLLYHALASPNVVAVDGVDLKAFPTLRELEIVESYVFGVRPPSLQELSALAGGSLLAIVVFAYEYRPAVDGVHRKHAELCFARTGVTRVGTVRPRYEGHSRGFVPFDEGNAHAFRVLPARYAAWIGVQRRGDEAGFGPMRFSFRARNPDVFRRQGDRVGPADDTRTFWVPIHKLFSGNECIQGLALDVRLTAHHVNEKLRRIHLELGRRGVDAGWHRPDIDEPPFRFTDGIAEFSTDPQHGQGLLVPVPHTTLVEPAAYKGRSLTFRVPSARTLKSRTDFLPTLEITAGEARHAPEYVHVRRAPGEPTPNLNDLPDPTERVRKGNYDAQHYVDYTGDGWIAAVCPQLHASIPRFVPAYSVVAAPDFFFNCDQRDVMEWWLQRAPQALRDFLWSTPPLTLSDERMAPNLKLNNLDFHAGDTSRPAAGFRPEDDTVTAIVSMPIRGAVQDRPLVDPLRNRNNMLPDGAAGVFAPGWDVSWDESDGVRHLTAYGLGSPFPEDSKLCAALSTFWPAVAPDAARSFSESYPTVCPLTDEELGQTGRLPWDGVPGPRLVPDGQRDVVEYADFAHVDYVENALKNRFTLTLTSRIGTTEYVRRVLAMARAYQAVGVSLRSRRGKDKWSLISFRPAGPRDADMREAEHATGQRPEGQVFRFELAQVRDVAAQPSDFRKIRKALHHRRTVLVGDGPAVALRSDGDWQIVHV